MTHPIIQNNRYLTLATFYDGEVWIAPLAYAYDDVKKVFYFYSDKNSKHARHIVENTDVAVSIYDSTASSDAAQGLQIKAEASIVEDSLDSVCDLYFEQSFPDEEIRQKWQRPASCFEGEALHRFFKIIPIQAFINDEKDMVDYRKEIAL